MPDEFYQLPLALLPYDSVCLYASACARSASEVTRDATLNLSRSVKVAGWRYVLINLKICIASVLYCVVGDSSAPTVLIKAGRLWC